MVQGIDRHYLGLHSNTVSIEILVPRPRVFAYLKLIAIGTASIKSHFVQKEVKILTMGKDKLIWKLVYFEKNLHRYDHVTTPLPSVFQVRSYRN